MPVLCSASITIIATMDSAVIQQATEFIARHEGMRAEAYRCPAGVWTIGYGHTGGDVYPGRKVTNQEALELLQKDVTMALAVVDSAMPGLSDRKRVALTSLVYNIGSGAFRYSSLRRKLRNGEDDDVIAAEFARWVYAAGRRMPGLEKRRAEEAAMFCAG